MAVKTPFLTNEERKGLVARLQELQGSGACKVEDVINTIAPNLIEKGRQLERSKFVTTLEKEYPAITTWRCWQGLKEGKP